nr:hypothetical protein B0A51_08989 [Rachicladosporium sp. CCFEE 5018]
MPAPTNVQLAIEVAFRRALVTCTSPWVLDYATNLPGTQITFHTLLIILSAVMCIIACSISLLLIAAHLLHWTRPREQRQMVRIIAFVPLYSIIALFCVWFYHASGFLIPFGQWMEGLALTCLFLFYVEAASPEETQRLQFFDDLERKVLSVFKPTPPYRVSWNDFAYAIPSFILTLELLCVAVAFIWSFGYSSYRRQAVEESGKPIAGPGSALSQVLDLRDVWEGVAFAFWGRVPRSWRQPPNEEPKLADLSQHIDAELAPVEQLDIELGGPHIDGARA